MSSKSDSDAEIREKSVVNSETSKRNVIKTARVEGEEYVNYKSLSCRNF